MAKRFTDTDKWKKKWFRELGSKLRDVRSFILDDCDLAGIWEIDLDRLSYHIGTEVTFDEVARSFNSEIHAFDDASKIFIPAFIEFQYGVLTESCNAHKAVIKRLRDKKVDTLLGTHLGTLPGRDQDQDKDKDQYKDQEKNKENKNEFLEKDAELCKNTWLETLKHFGVEKRLGALEADEIKLAIIRFGVEAVEHALFGARFEEKTDKFDPAKHVSLQRIFKPNPWNGKLQFEKFVNLGFQNSKKRNPNYDPDAEKKKADRERDEKLYAEVLARVQNAS